MQRSYDSNRERKKLALYTVKAVGNKRNRKTIQGIKRVTTNKGVMNISGEIFEGDVLVHRPQRRKSRYRVEPKNRMVERPALCKRV